MKKASAGHGRPGGDPRRHAGGAPATRRPKRSQEGRRRRKAGDARPRATASPRSTSSAAAARSIVGNIYKGKVDNVLPGLEAAFVDIGLDKNGFLHVDEIVLPGVEQVKRGRGKERPAHHRPAQARGRRSSCRSSRTRSRPRARGSRWSSPSPGATWSTRPTGEGVGVSRRLEDKERERLRKEAKQLDLGGGGAIIRTAAHGAKREDFERELQYLFKLNEVLQKRVEETTAPAMVFQEADLSVRVVRDIFSEHFERAIVDDPKQHQRLISFFTRTAPELVDRVELWEDDAPPVRGLRRRQGDRGDARQRRVDLPERRLPDDRLRRGADGHRRQHGLVHRPRQVGPARGHDHQDQPRGGRGGRQPAAAARHRRHHRHRLHRHGPRAQPRRRAQDRCASRSTRTARRPSWSRSRRSGWSR